MYNFNAIWFQRHRCVIYALKLAKFICKLKKMRQFVKNVLNNTDKMSFG